MEEDYDDDYDDDYRHHHNHQPHPLIDSCVADV